MTIFFVEFYLLQLEGKKRHQRLSTSALKLLKQKALQ